MKDFLQVFSPSLIPHFKKNLIYIFPVLKIKTNKNENENPHPNKILLLIIMSKA